MMSMGSRQRESWVRTVIRQAELGLVWQVEGLKRKVGKYIEVLAIRRD